MRQITGGNLLHNFDCIPRGARYHHQSVRPQSELCGHPHGNWMHCWCRYRYSGTIHRWCDNTPRKKIEFHFQQMTNMVSYTHIPIFTYTHIYIHTSIHTYIHTSICSMLQLNAFKPFSVVADRVEINILDYVPIANGQNHSVRPVGLR